MDFYQYFSPHGDCYKITTVALEDNSFIYPDSITGFSIEMTIRCEHEIFQYISYNLYQNNIAYYWTEDDGSEEEI